MAGFGSLIPQDLLAPDALPDVGEPLIPSGPTWAGTRAGNRLVGANGEERVQTWPEKLVRSALTLPGDVASGAQPLLPAGLRREDYTDAPAPSDGLGGTPWAATQPWQPNDPAYERAQDTAGIAGGGMMFGSLARPAAETGLRVLGKQLLEDSATAGAPLSSLERAAEQGYNVDAYHATRAPEFDAFKRKQNDIGMHFGTSEQANDRIAYTRDKAPTGADGERVMPVKLQINNPLRMDDMGSWRSDNLMYGLENAGFDPGEMRRLVREAGNESGKVAALRDMVKARGYDGIVYKNTGEIAGSEPFRQRIADARAKVDEAFGPNKYSFGVEDQQHPAYREWSDAQEEYQAHRKANAEDSYIAFHPSQVRSRFAQFDPKNAGKSGLLLSDSAAPGAPIAALEHAPAFYSGLERAVTEAPIAKGTGDQWLGTLSNRAGVKPEEMDWTGLRSFLSERGNQPVTKAELQDHLTQNGVKLGEVTKGDTPWEALSPERQQRIADDFHDAYPDAHTPSNPDWSAVKDFYNAQRAAGEYNVGSGEGGTKYSDYQLPGGENYREKLLTLPGKERSVMESVAMPGSSFNRNHVLPSEFKSSHWDEPNVLVHRRTNDREIDGTPSLHIEEIQSDWHQKGRKRGYEGDRAQEIEAAQKRVADANGRLYDEHGAEPASATTLVNYETGAALNPASDPKLNSAWQEYRDALRQLNSLRSGEAGVPNAPFKKNWHELALKDAIREAAEKGMDRISWTPGEAQAARYDLSKHIGNIEYNPATKRLSAWAPNEGARVLQQEGVSPEKLADYIGKEAADRILNNPTSKIPVSGNGTTIHSLSGLDLKVGGEGMKGFYDKMLPDALNKIGKPHGVKVQRGEYWHEGELPRNNFADMMNADGAFKVHYMDLPQSLKDQALKKGFSLFEDAAATGAPLAAAEHAAASGPVAPQYADWYSALKGAAHDPIPEPAGAANQAGLDVGRGLAGSTGRGAGLEEAQAAAARWAGDRAPLEGLPTKPMHIDGLGAFVPGPIGKIHSVAEEYMRTHHPDRPYTPPTKYHQLDPEHSTAIARAYEEMQHTPNDPATKHSYEALINETQKQYDAIKKTGLKIEPIKAGMEDPYAANPRLAARDVAENNHLWFFPTEHGFGTVNKISDNPMLRRTGEKIGDHELLANDMFRVVHDYFGHLKEGHGFRAGGEDNAWRTHAQMYSDIARPAMTTETRGQNSWVNYGPHGERNRKASAADTVYADQKVGLMPEWTMRDRGSPEPIIAYHGTPYSFDRFSMDKIGAGEGNQAYGHGLYFAGHSPVSEWYRHQLAARRDPLLQKYGLDTEQGAHLGTRLAAHNGDVDSLIHSTQQDLETLKAEGRTDKATQNMIKTREAQIAYLRDPERAKGHMYEVAIDANPEHFLDWDAALSGQPTAVQEIARNADLSHLSAGSRTRRQIEMWREGALPNKESEPTGSVLHSALTDYGTNAKNSAALTEKLKAAGIPGIRYLDQGSRLGDGKRTRNYVTFDAPRILKKYAVPGAVGFGSLIQREEN